MHEVGTRLGPYVIEATLGAGGMGTVCRARDTRLDRPVALKFPHPAVGDDPEARVRLLSEARAASALRSPHIAVIYDVAEHDGRPFIVMEYVEGETLAARLARGPLGLDEAVRVAAQVAEALEEAHGLGLVHRDIKSANIVITPQGRAKVLDFGLAKFVAAAAAARAATLATAPGVLLGTVSYIAPEQLLGRPLDGRADLFALGVVLFEMLTGRLPFLGDSAPQVIARILHDEPPPLRNLRGGVPAALETVVRKALEKDPAARYQTAGQFREALAELTGAARLDGARGETVSLAVMTLSNITAEPGDEWLGVGIAETLAADLKQIPGLSVIARVRIVEVAKAMAGGGRDEDQETATQVGRRVGATWVLVGGYQRVGEHLRVTAQVLDVASGAVVQTVKVDGTIGEIFALQDRLVAALTARLGAALGQPAGAPAARAAPRSVEAYEAFARGMINLRQATRDSLDIAILLFERATTLDPDYGPAWVALAQAYDLKGSFLGMTELVAKGAEVARRAVALDPRSADAHATLAGALLPLGQFAEAASAARRALELEPDHVLGHEYLARASWIGQGRLADGIAELERVVALNPLHGYAYLQLALLYALQGELLRAEAAASEAIALQERAISGSQGLHIVGAYGRLGYVRYLQGRYLDAIREYERELAFLAVSDHALRERTTIELWQKLGAAYLRMGEPAKAEGYLALAVRAFESRLRRGLADPFTEYYMACAFALRGDREQAWRWFAASSRRLPALNAVRARVDPDLALVRDDPRFASLWRSEESSEVPPAAVDRVSQPQPRAGASG